MVSSRVVRAEGAKFVKVTEGINRRSELYGEKSLLCEFRLEKGAAIPIHTHPHEQTGFMVSGKALFTIDGEEYLINPGDSWCVLGEVEHKVDVLEDSFFIEVFAPVREEFIAKD